MQVKNTITAKLSEALKPAKLNVIDESAKHAGHGDGGIETHFHIDIVSEKFTGMPMVKRHQMIYQALKEEMNNPIHALTIKATSPSETK